VYFTREPVLESIITPKQGYTLVLRSSKAAIQQEYFVESVEIVSFGRELFYRSNDRVKAFLLPVADYEVLEVHEARLALKVVGAVKASNPEKQQKQPSKDNKRQEKPKRAVQEVKKEEDEPFKDEDFFTEEEAPEVEEIQEKPIVELKRDPKRHQKRRAKRQGSKKPEEKTSQEEKPPAEPLSADEELRALRKRALLSPPETLISEKYAQRDALKAEATKTEVVQGEKDPF
jgi:hypothetical protein